MTRPVEDWAAIGHLHKAALVGQDGSIDWPCLPPFDSPTCFAPLLDSRTPGRWRIAPADAAACTLGGGAQRPASARSSW